jgi:hypothetical protein
MNIEHYEKLNQNINIKIHKCKICNINNDHCDFGCLYENEEELVVTMILKEIVISYDKIIYRCLYNNNLYIITKEQII